MHPHPPGAFFVRGIFRLRAGVFCSATKDTKKAHRNQWFLCISFGNLRGVTPTRPADISDPFSAD